ncbi:unnamed protein product [Urochloa decumbens]|uniref:DWNN domain-containing protein n=1 Tax=Urochloa decumbens TaxID=240449 RepID=A0ABC8X9A7_9POAL
MAVYYRYKSGVQTFSVPVAAPSVSVADLKTLILATPRQGHGRTRGRGPRETLALYDERTGEEYTDGSALIHRNSTVLVRRIAGPPAEAITVAASPSDSAVTSSSSAEDDEARAIDAVIDAAQLKWEGQHHPSQGGRRYGARGVLVGMAAPPAGYVCHRCRVPGHFIQHCPTNGDPRYDLGRAPPSNANPPAPSPVVSSSPDDGVPPELHCKICTKVMADAVVASRCCFGSFCDACARGQIAAKSICVCGASSRAEDLIPNLTLRATIAKLLATSAAASSVPVGTENRKSSAGSNTEQPTSQGAAASQENRSVASEHSGGSASSTSKSAAAPAARKARTKRTTAESAETGAHAGYTEQYGYGNAFGPACYDPFFGAAPWACDPYMFYGVPYGGGYMDVPAPAGYHDGCNGRKRRSDGEFQRQAEAGFKRRCGGRSEVAF